MREGSIPMAISFKGAHFPKEIILTGVRWYVAYPLSYRHVEELMQERGVHGRSRHDQSLGRQIQSPAGRGVPPPQAAGVDQLADGRDVYQGQRAVERICIVPWIRPATPSISCSRSTGTSKRPGASSPRPSAVTVCPRRSPSMGARPMQQLSESDHDEHGTAIVDPSGEISQ